MTTDRTRARGLALSFTLGMLLVACVLLLSSAPSARAYIYWTNAGSIGRANNDGTGANQHFIGINGQALGVAVDDAHIYWTNSHLGTIGRANLDGSDIEPSWIHMSGDAQSYGIAVNDKNVYWSDKDQYIFWHAKDGSGGTQSVLFTYDVRYLRARGIAAYGKYVYWTAGADTSYNFDLTGLGRMGKDGGGATVLTPAFGVMYGTFGIWAGESYIYVSGAAQAAGNKLMGGFWRYYTYTGEGTSWGTGGIWGGWYGIAKDDDYIYWAYNGYPDYQPALVGRFSIKDKVQEEHFILACDDSYDVDVDSLTPAATVGSLLRQVGQAGLPRRVATPLKARLATMRLALRRGDRGAALRSYRAAVHLIRAQAGTTIPQRQARRWITALQLLVPHIV